MMNMAEDIHGNNILKVYEHSQQKEQPRKWIYDIDSVFQNCGPRMQNVSCTKGEAEIYIPFCHKEYNEKEKLARERFHVHERLRESQQR